MSLTKVEQVLGAYSAMRISGLTSAPSPGEIEDGLSELENMMNEFQSRNICSTYIFEDVPDPNTDSGIEAAYNNATQKCLAVRLAPYFGKEAPQTIQRQATQALSNWSARSGKANMIIPPNRQARGSGNNFRFPNWVRFYRQGENAPISCSTFQLKVNAINFFDYSFATYLEEDETIVSFTTDVGSSLNLINITQNVDVFTMEVKGVTAGYDTITITITTSLGRAEPQLINFNITKN